MTDKRKKKRKKIPAVTMRERLFLARMRANLAKIEQANDDLRERMGIPRYERN